MDFQIGSQEAGNIVNMNTKIERSIFVKCECKSIEEIPIDESEPIKITGNPKNIGEKICSRCGKQIILYASIWIGKKL